MLNLPKPEVILTHESDLDGFVAGLLLQRLAQKLFDTSIPLEAWNYNSWKNRELREQSAWVTDLSFESRLDKPNWVIVDHHALEATPRHAQLIHQLDQSAGSLCYALCEQAGLGSPALQKLVHLNNVADLFLEQDSNFVLAGDYANLVKTYQFWNLHALIEGELERLLDHPLLEVMEVKRRVENPIGLAWSRKHVARISKDLGYVETVVGNNNLIIFGLLSDPENPYPVLVTLFRKANSAVIASFRSRNGQAIKVAERFQGGGHPNAAGATLPKPIRSIPEAISYLREVLNPGQKPEVGGLEDLFQDA